MSTPARRIKYFTTDKQAFIAPDWFVQPKTAGEYAPHAGNQVTPFITGADVYKDMWYKMDQAEETVHIAMWSLMPGFRMLRGDDARGKRNVTIGDKLIEVAESTRNNTLVRVLLWDFSAPNGTLTGGDAIRYWQDFMEDPYYGDDLEWFAAIRRGDIPRLEVRVEKPAYPLGSHHQKTVVIDGKIAYCGGGNFRTADWDTYDNLYDNPLRDPGSGPRHDTFARIEGPLVKDLQRNFAERWDRTPSHPNFKSAFARTRVSDSIKSISTAPRGKITGQINRTMYQQDDAIRRSYLNAIGNAHHYIYIENQYFRDTEIATAIAERVKKRKGKLKTVIVTNPDSSPAVLGQSRAWTFESLDIVKNAYQGFGIDFVPNCLATSQPAVKTLSSLRKNLRYMRDIYQTADDLTPVIKMIHRSLPENEAKSLSDLIIKGLFDAVDSLLDTLEDSMPKTVYTTIDAHTKTLIVDDVFFTLGSANIHKRGMQNDSEINLAVADHSETVKLRDSLWKKHLGFGVTDFEDGIEKWITQAQENEKRYLAKEPLTGHALPLHLFMKKESIFDTIPILPPEIARIENEEQSRLG